MTDSDKTSQPRLEKKSLSIDAFDELRSIAFATQKADKVVTLEDKIERPLETVRLRKPHRRTDRPTETIVARRRPPSPWNPLGSGRKQTRSWPGRFGDWVREYTITRLAVDLDVDVTQVGRWARGDWQPSIKRAIAVVEVARSAGVDLSLEDIYEKEFSRIRYRIRNSLPPL